MTRNRIKVVGESIYMICEDCKTLVKLNKWLFGSLHFCLSSEERQQKQKDYQRILSENDDILERIKK